MSPLPISQAILVAPTTRLRQAVVVGVVETAGITTLTVELGGDSTPILGIRHLTSYAPRVDDVVWCLQNDSDFLAIGSLADQTNRVIGSFEADGTSQSFTLAAGIQVLTGWQAKPGTPSEVASGINVASNGVVTVTTPGLYEVFCDTYLVNSVATAMAGNLRLDRSPTVSAGVVTSSTEIVHNFVFMKSNDSTTESIGPLITQVDLAANETFTVGIDLTAVPGGGSVNNSTVSYTRQLYIKLL